MASEGASPLFTTRERLLQAGSALRRYVLVVARRRFWQRLALVLKGFRQLATELLLIALIVVAIVLLVEQVRTTSVRISVVAVPADLRANGFTEAAATELINSELEAIQQSSLVPGDGILPWRDEQAIHFTIPGAGFGLGDLAHEIK